MLKELSLEEIHKATLDNLKKIIEICDSQNINYALTYGSLIGAVRHKGFIPWDDDLDVMMLRPDYERFVAYCNEHKEEIKPFRITNKENTENYPYNITRFVNDEYIGIFSEKLEKCDFGGTFVDIYPFDGAGKGYDRIIKIIEKYKKVLMGLASTASQNKFYAPITKLFFPIKKIIYKPVHRLGCKYFLKKMDSLGKIYDLNSSEYVACMVWDWKIRPIKKDNFLSPTILEFEKIKVKCPKNVDEVLKTYYGDYMKLPPVEQRACTHDYKIYRQIAD